MRLLGSMFFVLLVFGLPLVAGAQETQPPVTHVVIPGETLYGIAARYGVTAAAIAEANGVSNLDLIRSGTVLTIPTASGRRGAVHVVKPGEYLAQIASQYGMTVEELAQANSLMNPSYVYVGQRLFVPPPGTEEPTPVPSTQTPSPEPPAGPEATATGQPATSATPAPELPTTPAETTGTPPEITESPVLPAACPAGCAAISIISPTLNLTITSPVFVAGLGSGFEQSLVVRVLDGSGTPIGQGAVAIVSPVGQLGPYSGTVTYTVPLTTQLGRVQVYSISPRDGAIEQLTSTSVTLLGSGEQPVEEPASDATVNRLQAALDAGDLEALADLMTDPWMLSFYQSETLLLSPAGAIAQLEENYLAPGQVQVFPELDAQSLLGVDPTEGSTGLRLLYSTGWGPEQADDAFLILVQEGEGEERWGGMLYVFDALRDY